MKSFVCSLLILSLVVGLTGCATSQAELQAEVKVSKADAERAALARVPGGTIQEGELEKEHGRVVWSFDVATPGTRDVTEIHVDAVTGQVVNVEKETPAEQDKERRKEH